MTTSTSNSNLTPDEIADLGEKIYRERIRPTLTDADIGKFVHIDVNSGEYEIDDDDITGNFKLRERVTESRIYGMRIGYSAAYFLGGYDEEPRL